MAEYHPFEPIIFDNSHTLILGTFPSFDSFKHNFYYSHKQNQFWKILSEITSYPVNNIDQKIWLLKSFNLALWDMVKSCNRSNSLDSSLKDIEVNDIASLLKKYPNIKRIAFTSRMAQKLFLKHFSHLDIETIYLPSPSPANARVPYKEKVSKYKVLLEKP